eukprot:4237755-Amphidinium_carterae.1
MRRGDHSSFESCSQQGFLSSRSVNLLSLPLFWGSTRLVALDKAASLTTSVESLTRPVQAPLLFRHHLVQLQILLIYYSLPITAILCLMTSAWGCSEPKLLASKMRKARLSCSLAKARLPGVALAKAKLWSPSVTATSGCSGP